MIGPGAIARSVMEERGGVLVLVAVALPVLVLAASLVLDAANWFEHKHHLQLQADAAALAAAHEFRVPCVDQPILDKAADYSGGKYNAQIGGTAAADVHMEVNSRTYYNQSSPSDDTVVTGGPCAARMVDVKMTETDLPWYFRLAQVPFIDAHARVSIFQTTTSSGSLPIGVPDVNPKSAKVTFVDETTDPPSVLGSRDLTKQGGANGLNLWDNSGSPLPVTVNTSHIGVRVALGGRSSTNCTDPLVECYDLGSSNGLLHARGWSNAGSGQQPNPPVARSVTLFNGTCTDPYFVASSSNCTIGVRAKVDFGVADPSVYGARVTATVAETDYPLTYDASSNTWQSAASISIPPGIGPVPVDLKWEETVGAVTINGKLEACKSNGNKCKGSFGTVQRTFSAGSRSGPIKVAQIWENGAFWANSFERCSQVQTQCTHDLVVKIGIQGTLGNASSGNDPVVSLRVAGGSQNQSVDCDDTLSNLKDELALGCGPSYTKNSGQSCPGTASALWGTAQPWRCTAIQTGGAVNQVADGLNLRILGDAKAATCTAPNHWSSFPNFPEGDKRIVQVFLTPYGSFSGSGSGVVPVTGFAAFYVTGWTGQGNGSNNPCQGNGDDPVPNNDAGLIVGHFIKYVDTLNGGGGTEACDFDALGTCVAVLTK
jgi:Flp pilus assembly protein TadG